jgi:muramoyltetrapeptide carboxypeptidase
MYSLQQGDCIAIVAPGSQKGTESLDAGKQVLHSWGLVPHAAADLLGEDLLYANSDEKRFYCLKEALYADDIKAIWCLRGGSGSTRLIPYLEKLGPAVPKIFIGFSDITALHLFFYQRWGWPTCLHGPALKQIALHDIEEASVEEMKEVLFGKKQSLSLALTPLNPQGSLITQLQAPLTGGNLSLIQASLATSWQIKADGHILILEDIDEKPYRTAERLEHLRQAGIFKKVQALIFGDFNFSVPVEPSHIMLYPKILHRFAREVDFPVFNTTGIGHTKINHPFWLGKQALIMNNKDTDHYFLVC